jgi:hypothetical protein
MNLGRKVKVVSRFAEQPFYPKEVGARGCFHFAPTPVDKCAKSLIYKEVEVGARGAACSAVHLAPTPT